MDGQQRHPGVGAASWASRTCPGGYPGKSSGLEISRLAATEASDGGLEVEAQSRAGTCTDADRTELGGVFVDPGAVEPEVLGELVGGEEPHACGVRVVWSFGGLGWLVM